MVREITIVSFVVKLLLSNLCFASNGVLSEAELKKYKEEAQSSANKIANRTIKEMFKHDLDSSHNANLKSTFSHYKGENVEGAGLDIKRAEDKGAVQRNLGKTGENTKCTEKECELGKLFSSSAINDRDVKLEEAGFKKDAEGNVIDNKGYIDKAKKMSQKAVKSFDFIKGEYKNCIPPDSYTVAKTKESCDQYYDVAHNNCPIDQVVEIDPRYIYQCSKKRDVKEKVCNEYVILSCKQKQDCMIDKRAIRGIRGWEYNYPILKYSSGLFPHCNGCCKRNARTILSIRDKEEVGRVVIRKVSRTNFLQIKVNGAVVYNTLGGYKLEIIKTNDCVHYDFRADCRNNNDDVRTECGELNSWVVGGNGRKERCLYNTCKDPENVNIDISRYLKKGNNEIELEVVYSWGGIGLIELEARQECCHKWDEKKEVKCRYVD